MAWCIWSYTGLGRSDRNRAASPEIQGAAFECVVNTRSQRRIACQCLEVDRLAQRDRACRAAEDGVLLATLFHATLLAPASLVQLPLVVFQFPLPPVMALSPAPAVPGVMSQVRLVWADAVAAQASRAARAVQETRRDVDGFMAWVEVGDWLIDDWSLVKWRLVKARVPGAYGVFGHRGGRRACHPPRGCGGSSPAPSRCPHPSRHWSG